MNFEIWFFFSFHRLFFYEVWITLVITVVWNEKKISNLISIVYFYLSNKKKRIEASFTCYLIGNKLTDHVGKPDNIVFFLVFVITIFNKRVLFSVSIPTGLVDFFHKEKIYFMWNGNSKNYPPSQIMRSFYYFFLS